MTRLLDLADAVEAPNYNQIKHADLDLSTLKSSWDEVPEIKNRFMQLCKESPKLMALYKKEIEKPSRSEYDFAVIQILKRSNWNLKDAAQAIYLSTGKGKESTTRDIIRAYNRSLDMKSLLALPDHDIQFINNHKAPDFTNLLEEPKRLKLKSHRDADPTKNISDPLFYELYEKNSFSVMYGASNVGKSFLMLDQAASLAAGKDWGDHEIGNQMGVLYLFAEAGSTADRRLEAVRRKYNFNIDTPTTKWPFFFVDVSLDFTNKSLERDDVNDILILIKQAEQESGFKIGLVVVDTMSMVFKGNENSSQDVNDFITSCKPIQEIGKTAVSIVHHAGKEQSAGARGSSALRAATDTEIEVNVKDHGNNRIERIMVTKKQREGATNNRIKFGLKVHEVSQTKKGKPVTSCSIVLESDAEAESILPNTIDTLTDKQKAFYYAHKIAHDEKNGENTYIYAYYKAIREDMTLLDKPRQNLVQFLIGLPPISLGGLDGLKSTFYDNRKELVQLGLIEKDKEKQ